MVSGAFEHMLMYGDMRELSEEELARAVRIDPRQISGLGPSLEALRQMLLERKRKILEKYETDRVQKAASRRYRDEGQRLQPPKELRDKFQRAFRDEQFRELEDLWYRAGGERSDFAEPVAAAGRIPGRQVPD